MDRNKILDDIEEIFEICQERNIGSNETELDIKETITDYIVKKLTLTDVGSCQFEAYATFCIECDRKGMKPLKYRDYLKIG